MRSLGLLLTVGSLRSGGGGWGALSHDALHPSDAVWEQDHKTPMTLLGEAMLWGKSSIRKNLLESSPHI